MIKGKLILILLLVHLCGIGVMDNGDNKALWMVELQNAMSYNNDDLGLKLISYKNVRSIKTRKGLERRIKRVSNDDAICAFSKQDTVIFTTMKEFKRVTGYQPYLGIAEYINSLYENTFPKDLFSVKLFWSYMGKQYCSLALVSNSKGVIYDPIGSNVMRHEIIVGYEEVTN